MPLVILSVAKDLDSVLRAVSLSHAAILRFSGTDSFDRPSLVRSVRDLTRAFITVLEDKDNGQKN